jgi:hypothetical protein
VRKKTKLGRFRGGCKDVDFAKKAKVPLTGGGFRGWVTQKVVFTPLY